MWDPPTNFCPKCKAIGHPIIKGRAVLGNLEGLVHELAQAIIGTEKERIAQERTDILREFKRIMSPEKIDKMTYRDLMDFISYINNKSPHHDILKDLTIENFDQVRRNLDHFLYGSDPMEDRINAVLVHGPLKEHPFKIEGLERIGSLLLHLKDPRYCIWNDKTQDVLLFHHLVERNNNTWEMYEQNLKIQTRLAKDLDVDLYYLDYLLKKIK